MKRRAAAFVSLAFSLAWAAGDAAIAPFSTAQPGASPPPPWRELRVPGVKTPEFALVQDGDATVLRVRSEAAAGTLAHALDHEPRLTPMLSWRWKIDRVVAAADMSERSGDDFAARVYVFFDVPLEALSFAAQVKIRIGRALYGAELPTAAICYVWDNRHPVGRSSWNPYTDRVRMVVLQSGGARAGEWFEETRDLEADFRAEFGWLQGPVPRITGIAAGNDTDQTRETATAWFSDFRLGARR